MIRMDRFVPESFRGKILVSTFLPHGKAGNRLPSVCRGEGIQDSIRQWRAMESRHLWAPATTAVVWAVWRTLREVGLVLMGSPLWNHSCYKCEISSFHCIWYNVNYLSLLSNVSTFVSTFATTSNLCPSLGACARPSSTFVWGFMVTWWDLFDPLPPRDSSQEKLIMIHMIRPISDLQTYHACQC